MDDQWASHLSSDLDPEPDSFLFEGKMISGAILLTLSTEIALKAWQCRERKGDCDHTHDLLKLFTGLSEESQTRLEKELPVHIDPISERLGAYEFCPVGAGLRKVLEFHRYAFERCRYLYECHRETFYQAALDEALTVIIETYDRTQD